MARKEQALVVVGNRGAEPKEAGCAATVPRCCGRPVADSRQGGSDRRQAQGWPRLAIAYRAGGAGRGSGHSVPGNTEAFSRNQPTPSEPAERAMTHDLFPLRGTSFEFQVAFLAAAAFCRPIRSLLGLSASSTAMRRPARLRTS